MRREEGERGGGGGGRERERKVKGRDIGRRGGKGRVMEKKRQRGKNEGEMRSKKSGERGKGRKDMNVK